MQTKNNPKPDLRGKHWLSEILMFRWREYNELQKDVQKERKQLQNIIVTRELRSEAGPQNESISQ